MSKLKLTSCLILLVLMMLGGAGCQRAGDGAKSPRKEVSLLHYFSFSGSFAGTMDSIADDFNRTSTSHLLKPTPLDHESFKTSIIDDLRLGKSADAYTYWAGARVQSILDKLAPIDDALPPAEMNKLFASSVVQSACTYNGRIYLVPVTQHFVGFFYNKKIFAQNGLTPPKTWDEFLQLGQKLRGHGITPVALGSKAKWPAQFWFDYLLLRTAPLEYRQKLMAGEAAFTDPEVVRVFSMWRDLLKAGMFNTRPNEQEFDSGAAMMVRRGDAAMTLMGTWLMGYFDSPETKWRETEDYGFFPFPEIDPHIAPVALGPIDGLVLPAGAKNAEGAKAVLQHFAASTAQETISRGSGAIAPNVMVLDASYSALQKSIRKDISRTRAWAFNYDLATPPERAEIGLNLFAEFLEFPDQYLRLLKKAATHMEQHATDHGQGKT